MNITCRITTAVAATAVVLAMGAATAQAASTGTASGHPGALVSSVTVPNKLVGFDAAVAAAHGYKIVTVDGHQVSVKVGTNPAAITPQNTVYGDCGTSSISIYNEGNKTANVYWDFTVDNPAIYYDLNVAVTDRAGTGNKEFYGWLAGDYGVAGSWTNTKHSVTGPVTATISWGYAELEDGEICYTEGPTDSTTLT